MKWTCPPAGPHDPGSAAVILAVSAIYAVLDAHHHDARGALRHALERGERLALPASA